MKNNLEALHETFNLTQKIFEIGHFYFIKDKIKTGMLKAGDTFLNVSTGYGCVFIYLGKQGKHHVFKSVRGGWSRTYTDAQLIGKLIQEVINES